MRMRARGHWDLDPRAVSATTYQEMRFLTDAARGEGSFERLPSIFQDLDRYLQRTSWSGARRPRRCGRT